MSKRFMLGEAAVDGGGGLQEASKPYTAHLKLAGCKVGEFTCHPGALGRALKNLEVP